MKRMAVASIGLALIAGCVNTMPKTNSIRQQHADYIAWQTTIAETGSDHGAYPKNYKKIIQEYLQRSLKDPDSAKYSNFTEPKKTYAIENKNVKLATYGYSVCTYINAKNSYGGYTGNHMFWFFIKNNEVLLSRDLSADKFSLLVYKNDISKCLSTKS